MLWVPASSFPVQQEKKSTLHGELLQALVRAQMKIWGPSECLSMENRIQLLDDGPVLDCKKPDNSSCNGNMQ